MSLFVAATDAEVGGAADGFAMGFVRGCSMGLVDVFGGSKGLEDVFGGSMGLEEVFGVSEGLDGKGLVGGSTNFEGALAGAAAGLVAVATGFA
jgi:hypothetical protein